MTQTTLLLDDVKAETLQRNVHRVLDDLENNRYGDDPPAHLIAVTKTVTPRVINMLKPLGISDIGENRAQVALPKLCNLDMGFRLHWIGRLQTNKVKSVIGSVSMLHSLDRMELANEVNRRAGEIGRVLPVLVQVNIAGESQKGGLSPEDLLPFLKQIHGFSSIQVKGLMAIMPIDADEDTLRSLFRGMRLLFDQTRDQALEGIEMQELSMGMSRDYKLASQAGATMVRIGTALYRD